MFNLLLKVYRRILVSVVASYSHVYLRAMGCEVGQQVRLGCPPVVFRCGKSQIKIGDRVTLSSCTLQNPICSSKLVLATQMPGAEIIIGEGSGISCSVIYSVRRICIGKNVNIGADCRIFDTDFHPMNADARRVHDTSQILSSPVFIEDDVWLGANVTVLKGVTIGKGTVIACGSVVTRDIPPNVVAGGIPARVLRIL